MFKGMMGALTGGLGAGMSAPAAQGAKPSGGFAGMAAQLANRAPQAPPQGGGWLGRMGPQAPPAPPYKNPSPPIVGGWNPNSGMSLPWNVHPTPPMGGGSIGSIFKPRPAPSQGQGWWNGGNGMMSQLIERLMREQPPPPGWQPEPYDPNKAIFM